MQTPEIRSRFNATGVVRLDGAFTTGQAAAMRDAIWQHAERQAGIRAGQPADWTGSPVVNWQGLSRDPVFGPLVDNQAVRAALDAIFGAGGWRRPRPGAQILFSLPEPGPCTMPDGWHIDCGFDQPTWPVPAVKLFAFAGKVVPRGGGTLVLPGSHRLVDRYRQTLPAPVGAGKENWTRFMRHDPWLAGLLDGAGAGAHVSAPGEIERAAFPDATQIDGVPVEVAELTGSPGDVVITHLHVFHARSPDTGTAPRLMLGKEIRRS